MKCNKVEEALEIKRAMSPCIEKSVCEKESECNVLMSVQKDDRAKHERTKKKVKELENKVYHLSEEVMSKKETLEKDIVLHERIKEKLEEELKTAKNNT